MELHLFVLQERKNIFPGQQISPQQRGVVMAFIPDPLLVSVLNSFQQFIDIMGAAASVAHIPAACHMQ